MPLYCFTADEEFLLFFQTSEQGDNTLMAKQSRRSFKVWLKHNTDHLRFTVPSYSQCFKQDPVQELTHRFQKKHLQHSPFRQKHSTNISPTVRLCSEFIRMTVASGENSFSKKSRTICTHQCLRTDCVGSIFHQVERTSHPR